ncbi:hypothetical protein Emed_000046 [Eimeria media]
MPLDVPPRECSAAAAAAAAAAALEAAVDAAANGKPRGLLPATLRCSRAGVQQLFCRVNCNEFAKTQRALIDHFVSQVLPTMSGAASRLVVIVESFLEVCRLRAALREQRVTHSVCHEYTSNAKLSRSRQGFLKGDVPLLVATSRFCFYRRYRLSGAQRVIFLGPPCSPEVYVHLLTESLPAATDTPAAAAAAAATGGARVEGTALCYFTRFQLHSLERLMPLRQALQLLQAPQGRVIALS